MVIMKEVGMKATQWPIGRVEAARSGKDGQGRVVCVRTSKGSYTRLITKWIVLDNSD